MINDPQFCSVHPTVSSLARKLAEKLGEPCKMQGMGVCEWNSVVAATLTVHPFYIIYAHTKSKLKYLKKRGLIGGILTLDSPCSASA